MAFFVPAMYELLHFFVIYVIIWYILGGSEGKCTKLSPLFCSIQLQNLCISLLSHVKNVAERIYHEGYKFREDDRRHLVLGRGSRFARRHHQVQARYGIQPCGCSVRGACIHLAPTALEEKGRPNWVAPLILPN